MTHDEEVKWIQEETTGAQWKLRTLKLIGSLLWDDDGAEESGIEAEICRNRRALNVNRLLCSSKTRYN